VLRLAWYMADSIRRFENESDSRFDSRFDSNEMIWPWFAAAVMCGFIFLLQHTGMSVNW